MGAAEALAEISTIALLVTMRARPLAPGSRIGGWTPFSKIGTQMPDGGKSTALVWSLPPAQAGGGGGAKSVRLVW